MQGGPLSEDELKSLSSTDVAGAVTRLCARGLCDYKTGKVNVRYPLTRDVAYIALERDQRVAMHRALGAELAESPLARGLTATVVARHFARGKEPSRAADYYLEAAHAARASYQTKLAMRCYRRAVALLGEDDLRRLVAHEALEAIFRTQGRWRERRGNLTELRRLAHLSRRPYWVASALFRSAQLEMDTGHLSKALSAAKQAAKVARSAGPENIEVRAQALMAEILRDLGDMQGALSAVDEALEIAKDTNVSSRLRAEVLRARGTLLRRVGRVHESVECHAEAIAVFKQVGARRMEARGKNSLAYAMYVLGRFEDGVALALDAIRIDLAIGGRFQIAKTLANIGQCYAGLGDYDRALAYLKRARDAHERYGDQDSRADTLLASAEVLFERGDLSGADTYVRDAGALTAVTGSTYDSIHEKILRAQLARANGDPSMAVMQAFEARQAAEAQAYVAYHFYALAVEAAARVDLGETHTGILLATTGMGAIETMQGSEYGLVTRLLCCDVLKRTNSPQLGEMNARALRYVQSLLTSIRDPSARETFKRRELVAQLLKTIGAAPPEQSQVVATGAPQPDEPGETVKGSD